MDPVLTGLGWDAGWVTTFEPFAAAGRRPARVIAVHKGASIVRDGEGDRSASVSGRFRYEALGAVDYPAVGDWVALDMTGTIAAILPRRTAFRRMAVDRSSHQQAVLDDEQVMAANIDIALLVAGLDGDFNVRRIERYLAVAWSSGVDPVVVLNKADVADDIDERLNAVAAIAPGVPTIPVSARTGAGLQELRTLLDPGRPRRSWLVRGRQVDAGQRPARRGPPGDGRGPRG